MIQRIDRLHQGKFGQSAFAGVIGLDSVAAADAATAPLNPPGVGAGFGQVFFRMYFPSGVTVSTPAVKGHRPFTALTVHTTDGSN
jgi:hypothetical protein